MVAPPVQWIRMYGSRSYQRDKELNRTAIRDGHDRTCSSLTAIVMAVLMMVSAGCSKRETQTITPWLRVDVLRPRADDMIRVGRRAEIYEIRRGGRWKRLGSGTLSRYMILGEGEAVLVELNDGNGLRLISEDGTSRALPAAFGRMGTVYVPYPSAIDIVTTENPHQAGVYRYDLAGRQLAQFRLAIPDEYSDCKVSEGLAGYGMKYVPYMDAVCQMGSQQAKCLMLGPDDFVHVVDPEKDWSECGDFGKAGISMMEPAKFTLFN